MKAWGNADRTGSSAQETADMGKPPVYDRAALNCRYGGKSQAADNAARACGALSWIQGTGSNGKDGIL